MEEEVDTPDHSIRTVPNIKIGDYKKVRFEDELDVLRSEQSVSFDREGSDKIIPLVKKRKNSLIFSRTNTGTSPR